MNLVFAEMGKNINNVMEYYFLNMQELIEGYF
jgi:hypothetical protein